MFRNGFWTRSELTASLWVFRREFAIVGLFSVVINVLMLAPTLFMLQVYDRILVSRSELTLLAMSLLTLFFSLWLPSLKGLVPACWCAREHDWIVCSTPGFSTPALWRR